MCKAFSCIIDKNKKLTWKLGVDSHEELIKLGGYKDSQDTSFFVRCEVSPRNGSYLNPDKWIFKVDENNIPDWFSPTHKQVVMSGFRQYKKQLYKILIKNKKIVHPFNDIKMVKKVTS